MKDLLLKFAGLELTCITSVHSAIRIRYMTSSRCKGKILFLSVCGSCFTAMIPCHWRGVWLVLFGWTGDCFCHIHKYKELQCRNVKSSRCCDLLMAKFELVFGFFFPQKTLDRVIKILPKGRVFWKREKGRFVALEISGRRGRPSLRVLISEVYFLRLCTWGIFCLCYLVFFWPRVSCISSWH